MHNSQYGRWVARQAAVGAIAVVTAGVVASATAAAAGAQPSDSCSPASLMRAHAAAMTQMADYLDAHPDVEQVFTDARSKPTPQERRDAINAYTDTHPDVAAAMRNIHQPVMDLRASCGLPAQQGMMPGMMPGQ